MLSRPDPRSDRALLAAHAAGEPDAFDELVRRYADRLWAVALRTLRHEDDAADALQEAMLSAFRSAGAFRGDASVSTWLHRIVLNACLDRIRRERARPVELLGVHDRPTPRDAIADRTTHLDVAEALGALPLGQRLAVVLVDMQGFGVAEAAEILGTREGTVKSRCARGRARLAATLAHLRPAEGGPGGNPGARSRVERGGGPTVSDAEGDR